MGKPFRIQRNELDEFQSAEHPVHASLAQMLGSDEEPEETKKPFRIQRNELDEFQTAELPIHERLTQRLGKEQPNEIISRKEDLGGRQGDFLPPSVSRGGFTGYETATQVEQPEITGTDSDPGNWDSFWTFINNPLLPLASLVGKGRSAYKQLTGSALSPAEKISFSALQGVATGLSELTTPLNVMIGVGTAGLGVTANLLSRTPRMLAVGAQAALSGYFATSMGLHLLETVPNLKQAWEKEDWPKTAELLGYNSVIAMMTGVAGKHTVKRLGEIPSARHTVAGGKGKSQFTETKEFKDIQATSESMEGALTATTEKLGGFAGLKESFNNLSEWTKKRLVYEYPLREHREFKNDVRKSMDASRDVAETVTNEMRHVLEPLKIRPEYEIFRRMVVLEDFEATAGRGLKLPRKISLEDVQAELVRLEALAKRLPTENAKASPGAVAIARARHQELTTKYGRELAQRGFMDEIAADRNYYTHHILDYVEGIENRLGNLGGNRLYSRTRKGSAQDIDTNYVDVMFTHFAKIRMDNYFQDFITGSAKKYNIAPELKSSLTRSEHRKIFGKDGEINPGQTYLLPPTPEFPQGRRVKAWTMDQRGRKYPTATGKSEGVINAIEQTLSETERANLSALFPFATKARPKRTQTFLLDEVIADRLTEFYKPGPEGLVFEAMRPAMLLWKRVTLNFAGMPYQATNFLGDLSFLYAGDIRALLNVPSALIRTSPEIQFAPYTWLRKQGKKLVKDDPELMAGAGTQRVINTAGLFSAELGGQLPHPKTLPGVRPLLGTKAGFGRFNPMSLIETLSTWRENIPRMAKFMTDVDRIRKGGKAKTFIDVKGLSKMDAAGKAAREGLIDYGAVTPTFAREIRSALFPFATFYVKNFSLWARYARTKPKDMALKFGLPLGALWFWNNTGNRREVEAGLPDWRRASFHLNSGWKDSEGKDLILALQTPLDLAARMGGIDKIPIYVARIRNGSMTVNEATTKILTDILKVMPNEAVNLANPIARILINLVGNQDTFTKRRIVPRRLEGTSEGFELQVKHALSQVFTPYSAYLRADSQLGKALLTGPFDLPRALGYRAVDPEIEERHRTYEAVANADAIRNSKLEQAERAYLAFGTGEDFLAVIKRLNEESGPKLSNAVVNRRIKSTRVQLAKVKDQLLKALLPEEIERLTKWKKRLERKMMHEVLKRRGREVQQTAREAIQKRQFPKED